MDFPFEYVERVIQYPSFDHHAPTKTNFDKKNKKAAESEEDVPEDIPENDDEAKEIMAEIKKLEEKVKDDENSFICTSSDSEGIESIGDTTSSEVSRQFETEESNAILMKKFKIMNECCCTASECESNSEGPTSSSSSSTSDSSEDVEDFQLEGEVVSTSSEETKSTVEENLNIVDEIEYLEEMQNPNPKKPEEVSETDSEEDDEEAEEVTEAKSSEGRQKTERQEVSGVETQESSSTSSASDSQRSNSDSLKLTSSDGGEDVESFKWDSDDVNASTDTDSELENHLDYLSKQMKSVDSAFAQTTVGGEVLGNPEFWKEKFKNFLEPLPDFLFINDATKYELFEEPNDEEGKQKVTPKQFWMVQQLDTGIMCSAKFVSRRNPEHLDAQKFINRERKLLFELLPELPEPSHIAKLLDAGFSNDFKYLIFEDLGTDLLTIFEEFGSILNQSTIFLLTYFTFNAIKELHSFDIAHLDISPTSFSVQQNPFNVKICDYSKSVHIRPSMKVSEEAKPDIFSARVFHQSGQEFDEMVDFESWIFTMIFLCTNHQLPWVEGDPNILLSKETFLNDPSDFCFDGCADPVPMAAALLAISSLPIEKFLERMNMVFSVDVMLFSDLEQPMLWNLKEKTEAKFRHQYVWSDEENDCELANRHWNPAEESDSDDVFDSEEEKKGSQEPKTAVEKKKTSKEERSAGPSSEASGMEPSSGEEPTSAMEQKSKVSARNTKKKQEPTSAMEPSAAPAEASKKAKEAEELKTKKTPKKEEEIKKKEEPKAPEGKKARLWNITRDLLLEMNNDLYGSDSSRTTTSSESSATTFSSWTSTTCSSDIGDEKRRWKWSEKSDFESVVDYYDDLDEEELLDFQRLENLKAKCILDEKDDESDSGPFSDFGDDERKELQEKLEKRESKMFDFVDDKKKKGTKKENEKEKEKEKEKTKK